jgi:molybdenum cofactor cytidylyltransferase
VIAGIVLAAGRSSRLGRPKQLLPLEGEPLLRFTLERILTTRLDVVYVVLGHYADEITPAIEDLPVRIVHNPRAAEGQSTSVLAGLVAASDMDPEAVMMLLGDQPLVDPGVVNALVERWQATHAPIVAPRYSGGPGRNPILFDRAVLPELMTLTGDVGARDIVRAHLTRGNVTLVDVAVPAPRDVDTEADFAEILALLSADQRTAAPCIDWCSEPE